MAMISELKNLKTDVQLLKKQTTESEQQRVAEIQKVADQKKELELKFSSFQEAHNKQKGDLHMQLAQAKKQAVQSYHESLVSEEKVGQLSKQVSDLLEERKRTEQRMMDD